MSNFSYANIDDFCEENIDKKFAVNSDCSASVVINGTSFSAEIKTKRKMNSMCKKYENALKGQDIEGKLYDPIEAINGNLIENGVDNYGNTAYKVSSSVTELELTQIAKRGQFFVDINNKLSDPKYLECVVNMMPKKKNGLLYSKRVTQIASMFCMDENANMYVLCAIAQNDTQFLIELRQLSVSSTEKFDADVITSTNNFSADTKVKAETKEEAKLRKARKYITNEAPKEEPMGPYSNNRQDDILLAYLIDSGKVSFTYDDLVEMENGKPDEEIEEIINEFFETYDEKKNEYIEDYLSSGFWKVIEEAKENDNFVIEDGVLKSHSSEKKKLVVPDGVKKIADGVFSYAWWIKEIVLPEGLVEIGERAFEDCRELQKINIPSTVEKIGYSAFASAESLERIELSPNIKKIDRYVFGSCESLKEIKLPEKLKEIGEEAFSSCKNLLSIELPEFVEKIHDSSFHGCVSLKKIDVHANNKKYDSRNACNAIVETKSNKIVVACQNTVIDDSITEIAKGAFNECANLNTISFGVGLEKIGDHAFSFCKSLKEIVIPDSVVEIGKSAFSVCDSLEKVYISKGVKKMGVNPFMFCENIRSIVISPDNKNFIGIEDGNVVIKRKNNELIFGNKYSVIPAGIKKIADSAFYSSDIENVSLPEGIEEIGKDAFHGCNLLKEITIPASVKKISVEAFGYCRCLSRVVITGDATVLEKDVFIGCKNIVIVASENSGAKKYAMENDVHFEKMD